MNEAREKAWVKDNSIPIADGDDYWLAYKAFCAGYDSREAEVKALRTALQALIDREYMVSPSWSSSEARDAVIAAAQAALSSGTQETK